MTTSPAAESVPASTCCGEGGAWAPKAGQPRVVGCMLCPKATGAYWRKNRSDGREYVPVKPLGEGEV